MNDNRTPSLSGREICAEWLTLGHVKNPGSNAPYEYTASDGTFVLWSATLDFDYHMGYLLECRYGPGGRTSDFLFCYQRHAGTDEITVEWAQSPHQVFGGEWTVKTERALVHRWSDWVYDIRAGTLHGAGAVKPFKLRVDWICHDFYDDEPVTVALLILGEDERDIHVEDTVEDAVAWAIRWLADRGFAYQAVALPSTARHLTLFPVPIPAQAAAKPASHQDPL